MTFRQALIFALNERQISARELAKQTPGLRHEPIYALINERSQKMHPSTIRKLEEALDGKFTQMYPDDPNSWIFNTQEDFDQCGPGRVSSIDFIIDPATGVCFTLSKLKQYVCAYTEEYFQQWANAETAVSTTIAKEIIVSLSQGLQTMTQKFANMSPKELQDFQELMLNLFDPALNYSCVRIAPLPYSPEESEQAVRKLIETLKYGKSSLPFGFNKFIEDPDELIYNLRITCRELHFLSRLTFAERHHPNNNSYLGVLKALRKSNLLSILPDEEE